MVTYLGWCFTSVDVILHILRRCPASIRHQHLWFGLSLGRAEQHNTDNVEPERNEPYRRNHVCSFISTPSLKLHITSGYGSRSLDLEHSCALSPNSFQSHCVFLFRCALLLLSSLHTVLGRAQRWRVRHHPRVTAILDSVFDLEPHHRWHAICTFSQT